MTDFRNLKTCIFGIQGSGKTHFARTMYRQFDRPLVFVVNKDDGWAELPRLYVYQADNRLQIKEEFAKFIKVAHKWAMEGKVDAIIIDEADLFFQTNWDLDPAMTDLVLNHRHIGKGVALWLVTRRPQDIPTKIVESSQFLIIFKLEGVNAIQRFREIHGDLPRLIEKIDYTKHNFVFKELGKDPYIHKALETPKKSPKSDTKEQNI